MMNRNIARVGMIVTAATLSGAVAKADTTYSTTAAWSAGGSSYIYDFGKGNGSKGATQTYGETFIAPTTDNVLEDFTFYLTGTSGFDVCTFTAEVYEWNGDLLAGNGPQGTGGAALFTSAPITFHGNGSFQAVTVDIAGGLALTGGDHYLIDFTADIGNGQPTSYLQWGMVYGSHPAGDGGGGFNFNNGSSGATNWDDIYDFGDLAFSAHFTSPTPPTTVPDSGSAVTLLGLGLGGLAWLKRRVNRP